MISDTESVLSHQTEQEDIDMDTAGGELWAPKLFRELNQQKPQLQAERMVAGTRTQRAKAAKTPIARRPHRIDRPKPEEDRNKAGKKKRKSAAENQ